jgi:hypothetical protein
MKPFNLEKALAGSPVVTRNGLEVTELKLFKDSITRTPLVGCVLGYLHQYTIDGVYSLDGSENPLDLFMVPVKKKFYVTLYKWGISGTMFHSGVIAGNAGKKSSLYRKTLEFEYEE